MEIRLGEGSTSYREVHERAGVGDQQPRSPAATGERGPELAVRRRDRRVVRGRLRTELPGVDSDLRRHRAAAGRTAVARRGETRRVAGAARRGDDRDDDPRHRRARRRADVRDQRVLPRPARTADAGGGLARHDPDVAEGRAGAPVRPAAAELRQRDREDDQGEPGRDHVRRPDHRGHPGRVAHRAAARAVHSHLLLARRRRHLALRDGVRCLATCVSASTWPGRRGFGSLVSYVRATAVVAIVDAVGVGVGLAIIGVPARGAAVRLGVPRCVHSHHRCGVHGCCGCVDRVGDQRAYRGSCRAGCAHRRDAVGVARAAAVVVGPCGSSCTRWPWCWRSPVGW